MGMFIIRRLLLTLPFMPSSPLFVFSFSMWSPGYPATTIAGYQHTYRGKSGFASAWTRSTLRPSDLAPGPSAFAGISEFAFSGHRLSMIAQRIPPTLSLIPDPVDFRHRSPFLWGVCRSAQQGRWTLAAVFVPSRSLGFSLPSGFVSAYGPAAVFALEPLVSRRRALRRPPRIRPFLHHNRLFDRDLRRRCTGRHDATEAGAAIVSGSPSGLPDRLLPGGVSSLAGKAAHPGWRGAASGPPPAHGGPAFTRPGGCTPRHPVGLNSTTASTWLADSPTSRALRQEHLPEPPRPLQIDAASLGRRYQRSGSGQDRLSARHYSRRSTLRIECNCKIRCPVLAIHGTNDQIPPYSRGSSHRRAERGRLVRTTRTAAQSARPAIRQGNALIHAVSSDRRLALWRAALRASRRHAREEGALSLLAIGLGHGPPRYLHAPTHLFINGATGVSPVTRPLLAGSPIGHSGAQDTVYAAAPRQATGAPWSDNGGDTARSQKKHTHCRGLVSTTGEHIRQPLPPTTKIPRQTLPEGSDLKRHSFQHAVDLATTYPDRPDIDHDWHDQPTQVRAIDCPLLGCGPIPGRRARAFLAAATTPDERHIGEPRVPIRDPSSQSRRHRALVRQGPARRCAVRCQALRLRGLCAGPHPHASARARSSPEHRSRPDDGVASSPVGSGVARTYPRSSAWPIAPPGCPSCACAGAGPPRIDRSRSRAGRRRGARSAHLDRHPRGRRPRFGAGRPSRPA